MTAVEVKRMVSAYIAQAMANPDVDIETNKFDFKRDWYQLKDSEDGINEFLKDSTAIVNSYGGDDGIIVIGFNRKSGLTAATFKDCGLRDKTDLIGIIASRVDRPFNIDIIEDVYQDVPISIIHLPASLDKPHVIRKYIPDNKQLDKNYENEIFVRHGTSSKRAKKHDLDVMYAEKKNFVLDKQITASFSIQENITFQRIVSSSDGMRLEARIVFQNTGTRKLALTRIIIPVELTAGNVARFNFVTEQTSGVMKILDVDEIWILDRECRASSSGWHRDSTVKTLQDNRLNKVGIQFLPVLVKIVSGEVVLCNTNVVEYRTDEEML